MIQIRILKTIVFGLFLTAVGGVAFSRSNSMNPTAETKNADMKRAKVTKPPTKLSRANGHILSFRLGEKKGELGFLSSWLPDQSGNPTEIIEGPASMAVDSSGDLFFLDSIREEIQHYSKKGKFLKSIELPHLNDEVEHAYTDLLTINEHLLVLDTENYLVAKLSQNNLRSDHTFTRIPRELEDSIPLIIDGFSLDLRGSILVQNRYDGSVYKLLPPAKSSDIFILRDVASAPPFRASLNLDSQNRILGQEFNEQNPTIVEFFRWKEGNEDSEKLFALPSIPDLFFVEIVGVIDQDMVLAVFTGGEERSRLSQLLRYKLDGTLVSSFKLNVREIPWNMNHRYQIFNSNVFLNEYRNLGKRLRVMRFTL